MIGRRAGVVAAAAGLLFMLGLSTIPVRAWMTQRDYRRDLTHQAAAAAEKNFDLQRRAESLERDTEIERIARSSYHLVRPGEEAYVILPGNAPPAAPSVAPTVERHEGGLISRTWHKVASIF